MESEVITQILSIALIISIIVLFSLIVIFIAVSINKKLKEKREKEEKQPTQPSKIISNTVQTKMFSTENIKKFMEFDEIKDNMIVTKDGKKLIMVIKCNGINYDLMSSIEKISVEQGFVQFLNTLTQPVQIYVQARKVNLEESVTNYRKRLKTIEASYNTIRMQYERAQSDSNIDDSKFKKIKLEYLKRKNLYEYTKDIIENTEKMSLNKNILTKNYYIAISYFPENEEDLFKKEELLDMAFSELYTNAQAILRTLAVCGVTGKVLDSVELADLLYVAYNRDYSEIYGIDKAIRAGYDSLYTTAPDVINKKIEELDKMIKDRATILANNTIEEVTINSKRKKELEIKEKEMDDLIKEMAKTIIMENEGYIAKDIVQESVKQIENTKKINEKSTKRIKKEA